MRRRRDYGPPPTPGIREKLLALVPPFVRGVSKLAGVREIALMGSLATDKANPKDIDLLATIEDDADLAPLARYARQLLGGAQQLNNHGVDVFLADRAGHYIGRTCLWRDCRPGIRMSCDALHCGRREYLHDDFGAVRLSDETLASAAVVLWPTIVRRRELPADVKAMLSKLTIESPQVPPSHFA